MKMEKPKNIGLNGVEKTAILMNMLGPEKCFQLMQNLKDPEVRRLLTAMGQLRKAPIALVNAVLHEYLYMITEQEEMLFDESLTQLDAIKKGLGEDRAKTLFGAVKNIDLKDRKTLPILEKLDEKTLAEFLVEEHPQTIAVIVSYLELNKQLKMIKLFPDSVRTEVLLRMANLEYVDPKLIDELEITLEKQFGTKMGSKGKQFGGVESIAGLIESLDKKTMNAVLSRLENKDPLLTEEIRQHMFTFTDIIKIDDKGVQAIVRSVSNEVLLLSLKTAPEELRDKIFSVLSERAREMLKEDLEALGPQKVSDIEGAQRDVVAIVKQLEEEGKIVIGVGEDNELIP